MRDVSRRPGLARWHERVVDLEEHRIIRPAGQPEYHCEPAPARTLSRRHRVVVELPCQEDLMRCALELAEQFLRALPPGQQEAEVGLAEYSAQCTRQVALGDFPVGLRR